MTITTTPVSQSTSLFGGLSGKAQAGAGGLFGMLLSLFGQTAGAGQTQGGLNALTGLLQNGGQQMTAQMLQHMGQPAANGANLAAGAETSLPTAADLMALLQSLANNPAASPQLKALLGNTETLDSEALKSKFASLDGQTQQTLMDEMAALMLQMPQFQMQQVLPKADDQKTSEISSANSAPIAPVDKNAQPLPLQTAPTAPEDQTADATKPDTARQSAKDLAMAAIADALQASATTEDKAKTAQTAAAASEAIAHAKAMAQAKADATALSQNLQEAQNNTLTTTKTQNDAAASQIRDDKTALSALVSASNAPTQQQVQRKNSGSKATDSDATQSSAAITSASSVAQPQATNTTRQTAKAVAGIQKTAEAGSSTDAASQSQLRTAADTAAQTTALSSSETQRTAQGASFNDHLNKVNLSRTGAHIPVSEQVAVQMTRAMKNGHDQMTIKLQPGDLGKIEVKIDVSSDGRVTASFSVDQPATLDLLQKDHRGLERALTDAGLKADSGTLSFNLRNDNSGQQQSANSNAQQNGSDTRPGFNLDGSSAEDTAPAGLIEMVWHVSPDRVDVRI